MQAREQSVCGGVKVPCCRAAMCREPSSPYPNHGTPETAGQSGTWKSLPPSFLGRAWRTLSSWVTGPCQTTASPLPHPTSKFVEVVQEGKIGGQKEEEVLRHDAVPWSEYVEAVLASGEPGDSSQQQHQGRRQPGADIGSHVMGGREGARGGGMACR